MWKYKITKPASVENAEPVTRESLHRKAVSRILIVATAGVLFLLFDLFVGFSPSSVSLTRGSDGVFLIRPDEGSSPGHVELIADIRTDSGLVTKKYNLSLYPCERGETAAATGRAPGAGAGNSSGTMSEDELLAYEMRSVISSLNDDQSVRRVSLPDRLRTGESIAWSMKKKSNTAFIALAAILLIVLIYSRRLDPLEKIRKKEMDSVRRQLPEFASKLVLLLGAGMVLSAAFERIVEESRRTPALAEDYFYRRMDGIYSKIKETNSSMEKEFRAFARSSACSCAGSRELMRISNIISDNISKGVELTDKLRSESEALWLSRKRDSEERGRLAETKLTMPLTVFLLVLVVVTVSPALLEL